MVHRAVCSCCDWSEELLWYWFQFRQSFENRSNLCKGLVSKETVALRRWGMGTRRDGIKRVDQKDQVATLKRLQLTFRAFALLLFALTSFISIRFVLANGSKFRDKSSLLNLNSFNKPT